MPPEGDTGTARPRAAWNPLESLPVFLIAAFLSTPAAIFLTGKAGALLAGLVSELALGAVVIFWLTVVRKGGLAAVGFRFDVSDIRAGAGWGAVIYVAGLFMVAPLISLLLSRATGGRVHSPQQLPGGLDAVDLVAAGVFVVSAAFGEELFFRGFLFRSLREHFNFWVAGAVSSAAFGAAHFQPTGGAGGSWLLVATMFFVGFGFAWVYERRGNVVADMTSHGLFNLISLVLIAITAR
jgi:membrane protease YdiL (CAAX protease family)